MEINGNFPGNIFNMPMVDGLPEFEENEPSELSNNFPSSFKFNMSNEIPKSVGLYIFYGNYFNPTLKSFNERESILIFQVLILEDMMVYRILSYPKCEKNFLKEFFGYEEMQNYFNGLWCDFQPYIISFGIKKDFLKMLIDSFNNYKAEYKKSIVKRTKRGSKNNTDRVI